MKTAQVETILQHPDKMNCFLEPPEVPFGEPDWQLASVSIGPRQFPDDPQSPVWFTIAWKR